MSIPLHVLILEDSEDDALLIARELRCSGLEPILSRVETAAAMKAALDERSWDAIIADYALPSFDGLTALEVVREAGLDLPFILVSGTIGEEIAVAAMKAGAHDYVLKDNLARLGPAIQRELQEAKERQARRDAEVSLQESEARFRRMADSIQDGLAIVEDGQAVYVNDRACEIFGYPRDEYMQMTLVDCAAPEERERLQRVMAETVRGGTELQELECWIVRKDGTRRYIRSRYSRSRHAQRSHYAVTTDITERKLAEREVEERRRYLESLLAAAPDAIVTLDANHRVVEWNPGAEKLFGYRQDEAIGQDIDHLINSPDAVGESVSFAAKVMGGESLLPTEAVRCRKDGSLVDVILAGSPILVDGASIGTVAVYTDISERKRAERLLQALNEATLAVEQALTPDEIFTTIGYQFKKLGFACSVLLADADRVRVFPMYYSYDVAAVKAAEKLIRVKAESFSLPIKDVDAFRRTIWEGKTIFVDGKEAMQQVLPRSLKGLANRFVKILQIPKSISAPLILEDEAVGLVSVQSEDLVEEDIPAVTAFAQMMSAAWRKAQLLQDLETSLAELRQTQDQLFQAQKMEALGRLAGGIAHDFNNLLTVIEISTRLLERHMLPEDPLWEHVHRIRETSERAAILTRHLLSFSRREIVKPRVVNLNDLVDDIGRMLQRMIGEDVRLDTVLADDLWPVKVDPAQMEQVIVNLAVNARDAMPDGGLFSIETVNVVLDEAYAAHHVDAQPGEHVMLTITDTGIGMTDEVKAHLFEPFFTTKERGEGTGLGLSTVFGIIKQGEGHIHVNSELGQGTTFNICLPRSQEAETEPELPLRGASPAPVRGTETILIAEDEDDVRTLATQILTAHGYHVLAAENGVEALALSQEHDGPLHLLLTDVVMPHMNGRELAEQVRSRRPEIRLLYMSGYSDDVIAHRGALQEDTAILSKPFTLDDLTRKVRAVLDA